MTSALPHDAVPFEAGRVDVSAETLAALITAGALALHEVPAPRSAPRSATAPALPDALPLLVGITHDLRSPLSSMLMLIEQIRAGHSGPVTALQERQLGLLYSAAFGVASLTNDALDIARGAARDLGAVPRAPFSVSRVWRDVRALVQPIAEEKQLALNWRAVGVDYRVGHAAALHRVLLNLVTNALKFTTSGAVTVTAESLEHDTVRFAVADTGEGLPEPIRAQLRRSGDAACGAHPASGGLGIAMCQQMLGAMESRLEDWSTPGRPGCMLGFVLSLPEA